MTGFPAFIVSFGGSEYFIGRARNVYSTRSNGRATRRRRENPCRMLDDGGKVGPGEEVTISLVKDTTGEAKISSSGGKRNADVLLSESIRDEIKENEEEEDLRTESQKEIDRLRAAEKFIKLDEGNYECKTCGYVYEKKRGEFLLGIPKGTSFEDLPKDFKCPTCKSSTSNFKKKLKTVAGFAENQQYGFGSNTLTSGQKGALIWGALLLGFFFLLSGYFLS